MPGKDAGEMQGLWEGGGGGRHVYVWGWGEESIWEIPSLEPPSSEERNGIPHPALLPFSGWLPLAPHSLSHHVQVLPTLLKFPVVGEVEPSPGLHSPAPLVASRGPPLSHPMPASSHSLGRGEHVSPRGTGALWFLVLGLP